ncbi:hypothetical protein [Humisphaera borealis]|uniref:Uncharacterized protein n=1 Tax=Humisphaera borealis TaxID=2807512 RepID=A0A7M2WYY4_9BACT|nr:hypothetical protein [Humisphaera borealis]QOV90574.1 hypothetical protein IPV69_04200 [Humisphaera borealis]
MAIQSQIVFLSFFILSSSLNMTMPPFGCARGGERGTMCREPAFGMTARDSPKQSQRSAEVFSALFAVERSATNGLDLAMAEK